VIAVCPLHTDDVPVIDGVAGAFKAFTVIETIVVSQLLLADTRMVPPEAFAVKLVVILAVPCPEVMITPAGTSQS